MNRFWQKIKKNITSEFFKASFWVFLASAFFNGGNYLYHLLMARMLGPKLYGILEGTISFLYILSVPFTTLTLVVVKFVSTYKGKGDTKSIAGFFYYLRNKLLIYGLIGTIILLILSPLVISLLHLPSWHFPVLTALTFFIGLFSVLNKSVLQGLFKFFSFFVVNVVEIFSKIVLAIILVFLGHKALGAYFAIVASTLIGYIIAFYFIKNEKLFRERYTEGGLVIKYSIPVFLTTLSTTSLFTTDVILARYFFPGVESGYYAALSVLGKIVFFAVWPISIVMFPMISERHARGGKYKHLLLISMTFTLVISSILIAIYYLLPDLMVSLLFGNKYLKIVPFVGIFAVFIGLYSLCALLSNFYLSLNKNIVSLLTLLGALTQIILISLFHDNLLQIIQMSIIANLVLLIFLLLYYPFAIIREKTIA